MLIYKVKQKYSLGCSRGFWRGIVNTLAKTVTKAEYFLTLPDY